MLKKMLLMTGIILLISGCGSKQLNDKSFNDPSHAPLASIAAAQQDSPEGFIAYERTYTMYLRWTKVDQNLTGQLQLFSVQSSGNKAIGKPSSHAFSGVLDGENISLKFSLSDEWAGQTWTGTLKDKTLTLLYPSPSGKLLSVQLHPGTADIFNEMVGNLQSEIIKENDEIRKQEELKDQLLAEDNRVKKEQNEVFYANSNLRNDLDAFETIFSEHDKVLHSSDQALSSFKEHFTDLQAAFAKLKKGASAPHLTDIEIAELGSQLSGMESINASIQSDQASLESEQIRVDRYLSSLKDLNDAIKADWSALQKAVLLNSSKVPTADFTQQIIDDALKAIQKVIKEVSEASLKNQNTADGYMRDAEKFLIEATKMVEELVPIGS